jgi:hypothetical protein
MNEPDFLILNQMLAALAGLFGGLSVSFFWQPRKLHERGKLTAGVIIGSVSTAAAFALGGLIADKLNLNFSKADDALGIGYAVGILSVGVISLLANFFDKREDQDIVQVVKDLRQNTGTKSKNASTSNPKTRVSKAQPRKT